LLGAKTMRQDAQHLLNGLRYKKKGLQLLIIAVL